MTECPQDEILQEPIFTSCAPAIATYQDCTSNCCPANYEYVVTDQEGCPADQERFMCQHIQPEIDDERADCCNTESPNTDCPVSLCADSRECDVFMSTYCLNVNDGDDTDKQERCQSYCEQYPLDCSNQHNVDDTLLTQTVLEKDRQIKRLQQTVASLTVGLVLVVIIGLLLFFLNKRK